jgi:hypothetical protein
MLTYAFAAYFIPNLSMFLNFIGAINGVYIVFILPVMMYLKAFGKECSCMQKLGLYGIMSLGTSGGLIAVVTSIRVMIFSDNEAGGTGPHG